MAAKVRTRRSFILGGVSVIGGCAATALPNASGMIAVSDVNSDWRQYPCVAEYRRRQFQLTFVAARHYDDSMQALVARAFTRARPRIVIVEGFASDEGLSPSDASENAQRGESAWARGESALAVRLAVESGVPFIGGDPSLKQVFDILRAQGYTVDELFGNLILLATIQSIVAGQIQAASDVRFAHLFDTVLELVRGQQSLALPADYGLTNFYAWYESAFGVSFDSDTEILRRGAPDSSTPIGRLNIAWDQPRDIHLLQTIREQLIEHSRVLVVFGGAHLTALAPALANMLGPPVSACGRAR